MSTNAPEPVKNQENQGLENIINKLVDVMSSPIIGYKENLKETINNYLKNVENIIKENANKIDDNTKNALFNYLDFLISSGKIFEYLLGIALKEAGYGYRTLEDLLLNQTASREKRERARYLAMASLMMLPEDVQADIIKKPLNELRVIPEIVERELRSYIPNYLVNKGVKKEDMEPSIQIVASILGLIPGLLSQQYLILSRIFRPEVFGDVIQSVAKSSKDIYKEIYNFLLNNYLKPKLETKKEEDKDKKEDKQTK